MAGRVLVRVLKGGNIKDVLKDDMERWSGDIPFTDGDPVFGSHVLMAASKVVEHSTMGEAFQDSVGNVVMQATNGGKPGGRYYRIAWDLVIEPISKEQAEELLHADGEDDDEG